MNPPFFVEVLNRSGEVRHRQRVDALPIRIGRGYDNDFILDDRHACPHHAIIERGCEGDISVRDLGSKNGVILKGSRCERASLDGNTVFRLGHTPLRLRSVDFPTDDALTDTTLHQWEGWPPAMTGVLVILLLTLAGEWFTDTEKFEPIRYVTASVGVLSMSLLWCGTWALTNRLFAGHMRIGRHLFITACGLLVSEIISLLCSISAYAFSLEVFTRYDSHLAMAIVSGMVYFHLLTINPAHKKSFALTGLIVSLTGSMVILMINFQSKGYLADELFMSEMFSPAWRISQDKPAGDLLAETRKLKGIVDAERARPADSADDEGEKNGD